MVVWLAAGRLDGRKYASEDEPPGLAGVRRHDPYVSISDTEPGLHPLTAALAEEGFDDFEFRPLVESFARHLMVHIDAMEGNGLAEWRERISAAADARKRRATRPR